MIKSCRDCSHISYGDPFNINYYVFCSLTRKIICDEREWIDKSYKMSIPDWCLLKGRD